MNTVLRGADLKQVNFSGANMSGADLSLDNLGGSTDLCGAVLTFVILDGTKIKGARYDVRTLFPNAFDPRAAGMSFFPDEPR